MAVTTALTRATARYGAPVDFMLAVGNTGGSAINVTSIQPTVSNSDGTIASAVSIAGPWASPGASTAQVYGSQFNVQVGAGSTVYFPFSLQFHMPAVGGGVAQPIPNFLVSATVTSTDGTTITVTQSAQLNVNVTMPVFGLPPGSPPNPAPSVYGQLDFAAPKNSGLLPLV